MLIDVKEDCSASLSHNCDKRRGNCLVVLISTILSLNLNLVRVNNVFFSIACAKQTQDVKKEKSSSGKQINMFSTSKKKTRSLAKQRRKCDKKMEVKKKMWSK